MESPSICALTIGYDFSAMHAARTKKGMKVSLTPCSFSMRSFKRSRSRITAVMSTSLNVVRCAVLCCASSRCSAMRLRRVDIFSRVSREPGGAEGAEGAEGAVGAEGGGGAVGAEGGGGAVGAEGAEGAGRAAVVDAACMSPFV